MVCTIPLSLERCCALVGQQNRIYPGKQYSSTAVVHTISSWPPSLSSSQPPSPVVVDQTLQYTAVPVVCLLLYIVYLYSHPLGRCCAGQNINYSYYGCKSRVDYLCTPAAATTDQDNHSQLPPVSTTMPCFSSPCPLLLYCCTAAASYHAL